MTLTVLGCAAKERAMAPEVLKITDHHGCLGKWHNTPANQTTAAGPLILADGLRV